MKTWATVAAKHATLSSGIGLGAIPAMGWDSLDGFAAGVLLAGVGFAALNSSQRLRSCPLPPALPGGGRPQSAPASGRLAKVRRRVDGLLTGILCDDAEFASRAPARLTATGADDGLETSAGLGASAGFDAASDLDATADLGAAADLDATADLGAAADLDATAGSDGSADSADSADSDRSGEPAGPAGSPERQSPAAPAAREARYRHAPDPAGWPYPSAGEVWSGEVFRFEPEPKPECELEAPDVEDEPEDEPGLEPQAGPASEREAGPEAGRDAAPELLPRDEREHQAPREQQADERFWGPGVAAGSRRSRHGLDGPAANVRPRDGRRAAPRHAAPPTRFKITLGRTLSGARLTSRSAAHAAG